MGRAAYRRAMKEESKSNNVTYTLTKSQLDTIIKDKIQGQLEIIKKEARDEAVNTAMILMLTLPLEVLMDHYWKKSYNKRLPGFVEHVLDYYSKWQDGELDMDKLREDLWEFGGLKLVEEKN